MKSNPAYYETFSPVLDSSVTLAETNLSTSHAKLLWVWVKKVMILVNTIVSKWFLKSRFLHITVYRIIGYSALYVCNLVTCAKRLCFCWEFVGSSVMRITPNYAQLGLTTRNGFCA